ncbi:cysteine three histidine 1 [Nothobranchius furzeri]|uniref:mRNA decay activator protein ZFP36 n=1 Tax=Nothobranchius furzeri TaxID=105023 RepID=A0A9D2XSR4_NOTFU|nr:cysteine three histidine 1 [Nothobranchius furzeri]KAF7207347.1 C3H1 type-like 1 [Nothobranchius furzeri]
MLEDEELVDNLLCSEDLEDNSESGLSLTEALLPLVENPAPPLDPWVFSTRYKTELCTRYAATGSCKYAERCQFAHGLRELHIPFRHPRYKTELCRNYHTTGFCHYGSRCLFVHSPSELRHVKERRRSIPCRTFQSLGVCPYGTRCHFLHIDGDLDSGLGEEESATTPILPQSKEWKPQGELCPTFTTFGFCLYGTCCHFQHRLSSKTKPWSHKQIGVFPDRLGLPSSTSSNTSTSSSPPSTPPLATSSPDMMVHNAFTFSSHHLSDLLLPLALNLQQLQESRKVKDPWDSRAL